MTESIGGTTSRVAIDPEPARPVPSVRPGPAGAGPCGMRPQGPPLPSQGTPPGFLSVLLRALSAWPT
jgi:hypothetical protein